MTAGERAARWPLACALATRWRNSPLSQAAFAAAKCAKNIAHVRSRSMKSTTGGGSALAAAASAHRMTACMANKQRRAAR